MKALRVVVFVCNPFLFMMIAPPVISTISKYSAYWIVFCKIKHTRISVLSNHTFFLKKWIFILRFK